MRSPRSSKSPDSADPGGSFQFARCLGTGDVSDEYTRLDACHRARLVTLCLLQLCDLFKVTRAVLHVHTANDIWADFLVWFSVRPDT